MKTNTRLDLPNKPVRDFGDNQFVRFYPSGLVGSAMSGRGVWVKYKRKQENKPLKLIAVNQKWAHFDCPDRELLLVNNALEVDQDVPYDFDEFLSFSLSHKAGDDREWDRYMLAAPDTMGAVDTKSNIRTTASLGATSQIIMADSGGFQLRSGALDFIDPQSLVDYYSSNVDEGMTLDIPAGSLPKKMQLQCAEIQRANSKYIYKRLPSNVTLSTICHGLEIKDMIDNRKITEGKDKNDYQIMSFPSSMSLPPLKQLDRLCFLVGTGKDYKQYHMLGLYNLATMCLVARLAAKMHQAGRTIFVTSDATTAIVSAKWRVMHTLTDHYSSIERKLIGSVSLGGKYASHLRTLACTCPACTAVKYTDIYSHCEFYTATRCIAEHNSDHYAMWLKMVNEYANLMTDKEYAEYICSVNSTQRAQMLQGLDYIDLFMKKGFAEAHNKFAHHTKSMFSVPETVMFDEPQEPAEDMAVKQARIQEVIDRYYHYHGL